MHTTFTLISNAYKVLKDPDKRREYDYQHSLHTDIINATFNVMMKMTVEVKKRRCSVNVTGVILSLAIFHN